MSRIDKLQLNAVFRLQARRQPNIGNTLRCMVFTRSAITPMREIWGTLRTLSASGPGRFWAQSMQKRERGKILFFLLCK